MLKKNQRQTENKMEISKLEGRIKITDKEH